MGSKNKPPEGGLFSKLKRGLATVGFLVAADRAVMHDAQKEQAPVTSVEKSPAKQIVDRGPLLPDSGPSLDGVQEQNLEEEKDEELEPQADYDTDEAQAKRVERAIHLSDVILEKYNGVLTVIYINDAEESTVSLDEGAPGTADGDRSVLKYRFDDSGNCYVYGIGGENDEEAGVLVKSGDNQEKEILSLIDSGIRLKEERERIFNEAVASLEE